MRITINNSTITKEKAMKIAAECHNQTGEPVEVCTMLGTPVAYFINGQCIMY